MNADQPSELDKKLADLQQEIDEIKAINRRLISAVEAQQKFITEARDCLQAMPLTQGFIFMNLMDAAPKLKPPFAAALKKALDQKVSHKYPILLSFLRAMLAHVEPAKEPVPQKQRPNLYLVKPPPLGAPDDESPPT